MGLSISHKFRIGNSDPGPESTKTPEGLGSFGYGVYCVPLHFFDKSQHLKS